MKKLNVTQVDEVLPFIEKGVADHPLGSRLDPAYLLAFVTLLISSGTGAVFVDDLKNPTYGFVATIGKLGIVNEKNCFLNVVYALPDARNANTTSSLITNIEAYAKAEKCDIIRGASPRFEGSESIDHFWEAMGAVPEEMVFIKKLN